MKIIHIVHNFYGFSGASLQAKNLANAISKYDPAIEQIFVTRKDDNKKIEMIIMKRLFRFQLT